MFAHRMPGHRHFVPELPPTETARLGVEGEFLTLDMKHRIKVLVGRVGHMHRRGLGGRGRLEHTLDIGVIVNFEHFGRHLGIFLTLFHMLILWLVAWLALPWCCVVVRISCCSQLPPPAPRAGLGTTESSHNHNTFYRRQHGGEANVRHFERP